MRNQPLKFIDELKFVKLIGEWGIDWSSKRSDFNIYESMLMISNKRVEKIEY